MEPWTLENEVPSGEIGTFPTYSSLVRAQPFLSFPYVSIKTPFLVTIGTVDVVHEPIDDEQAEMHVWSPADFCDFGLEHAVPIHPIFEPYPLNANVGRWWNDAQFIIVASSRVGLH